MTIDEAEMVELEKLARVTPRGGIMMNNIIRERQTREHLQHLEMAEMIDEYHTMEDRVDAAETERDRLREAIKQHRWKKWAVGYVHDREDWELYNAALQEAGDE